MSQPQILINHLTYHLPSGKTLFSELTLAFIKQKIGLVGKNDIGKSTLIKLIIGELHPTTGSIHVDGSIAYIPQNPILPSAMTIAGFLGYEEKLLAFQRILQGSINEYDYSILNEDWHIEERLQQQLTLFGLNTIPYYSPLQILSGGELTRLLLTKAFSSQADFLLLDEPTNHLDYKARQKLYQAIQQWQGGLIIISHDLELLNLMEAIIELNTLGFSVYGGNYENYIQQKNIQQTANELLLHDAKKQLQKTKITIQSSREKHNQKQAHGRQLRKSGSIDKLTANAKRGRSERKQSKLLIKGTRLQKQAEIQLKTAREKVEIIEAIHISLPAIKVPQGKIIIDIENLSFAYSEQTPLIHNFNLKIQGPERIAIIGENGSGKSTLIKLILHELNPQQGTIYIGTEHVSYLDQNTNLLMPELNILENFQSLNPDINEQKAYLYLAQFLFKNTAALKLVKTFSGGEKLRAQLACIFMSKHPPRLLILDEPTNHLDLDSIQSIESALQNYQGTMILITHDQKFLENIGIERTISAPFIN